MGNFISLFARVWPLKLLCINIHTCTHTYTGVCSAAFQVLFYDRINTHMHTHTHALVYALKSSNCSFTTVMSYKQHILVLILLSVFSRKCCMFIYFWYSYACMPQGCWQTYAPPINQDKMNMFHVQDLVSKATQWDTISRLHGVGGYTQRTHSTCTALGLHTKYAFYLHGVGLHTKYTLYVF